MADQTSGRRTHTADVIKTDADRAQFFKDPAMDSMFNALVALGGEVWTMRRRQLVLEALLQAKGGVTREMVELYTPTAAEQALWAGERDAFVKAMMEPFTKSADIPYGSSMRPGA